MFWDLEHASPSRVACFADRQGRAISYAELADQVDDLASCLGTGRKRLVSCFCENSLSSLIVYLACLRSRHAVLLAPAQLSAELQNDLLAAYVPDIVFSDSDSITPAGRYEMIEAPASGIRVRVAEEHAESPPIERDLAVLLPTSGTTGSPKYVRLSYDNLQSNATVITSYLHQTDEDVAITSLPISYSYGLSVVNSHIEAGASLVVTNKSAVTRDFWDMFRDRRCTSLAGVPFTYMMLQRIGFDRFTLPTLRRMTQAGGAMSHPLITSFMEISQRKRFSFFVMYGQTEATARIAYVPPEMLPNKVGSIGVPIPGGALQVEVNGQSVSERMRQGELVYRGPNVMMGYAHGRNCLAFGDVMKGILPTGDLGHQDADGFFYVTGRLKRFIKIHGLRINTDDVENKLATLWPQGVACVGLDNQLFVFLASATEKQTQEMKLRVVEMYQLHHTTVTARSIPAIPTLDSGKRDYRALTQLTSNGSV